MNTFFLLTLYEYLYKLISTKINKYDMEIIYIPLI